MANDKTIKAIRLRLITGKFELIQTGSISTGTTDLSGKQISNLNDFLGNAGQLPTLKPLFSEGTPEKPVRY